MAPVLNGVYAIARPGEQLLTLDGWSAQPGAPAMVLHPTGNPGEQEWVVEGLGNGNCMIRNLKSGTYLGFEGYPGVNKEVGGYFESREWALYQSAVPFTFHVVVPGGPVDGVELAVDFSLLRIFPPRVALRPLDVNNPYQAWNFQFHG